MELVCFLSVKFKGECKLIPIYGRSKFSDIVQQIMCTWVELNIDNVKFRYAVGSIDNCDLSTDDDVCSLILICQHLSHKIVHVDILFDNINVDVSNSGGKSVAASNYFNTLVDKIPTYDVCMFNKSKPLLSDSWNFIMDDGVGLEFPGGAKEFRCELIKYTTNRGFKFRYVRNDARYIHSICSEADEQQCKWFIKACKHSVTKFFVVSKANLLHTCVGAMVNHKCNRMAPRIMGSLVLQDVRSNPTLGGKAMIHLFKDSYGMDIPYWKAHRTASFAKKEIFGSYDESYDQLHIYCGALLDMNPGNVADLENNSITNRFERIFIAFKACIDGFRCCRPMLFIDSTFMKGQAKGTMLVAIAKDGDNGLFPVAFAVVSAENKDNWVWFLEKIRDNIQHDNSVFFISDRNAGLMSSFTTVHDEPIHFFCLHHLMTNLKGRLSSRWNSTIRVKFIEMFQQCAYAPNKRIFDEKIAAFKGEGGKIVEEWLADLPYNKWAVAHSTNMRRYGEMTSNAAESFNKWILDSRSLPIRYMIDSIRKKIASWFVDRKAESKLWTGSLCPSKENLWHYLSQFGRSWTVNPCPNGQFEVESKPSVIVDLSLQVCTCYHWQVTGFPCSHVVAAIRKNCASIYSHIEPCFMASKYKECYSGSINPIPETELFERQSSSVAEKTLPPQLNRPPGRPKTKHKPSFGEFRKKKKVFCARCGKTGWHDDVTFPIPYNEARRNDTRYADEQET